MATIEQLKTALFNADKAGDAPAAKRIAQEIQRYRNAGVTDVDPNEGIGFAEQAMIGLGRSADKTGRGIAELALRGADMLGFDSAGRKADDLQATGQANTEVFKRNATGTMKGAELAGDIGQFAIPATKIGGVTRAASLPTRAAAQSIGAIGTDAIQQQGEGQEGIDTGRSALTGLFAGSAEFAAPVVARAFAAASKGLRGDESTVEVGRAVAREMGIADVSDELAKQLAGAVDEIKAGAKPGALIAEKEFGFNLTRGQKTGSEKALKREELLRQIDAGKEVQALDKFNAGRQSEIVRDLTGGLDSPQTAVDNVQSAVTRKFAEAKDVEKGAWKFAKSSDLIASGKLADDYSQRTIDALRADGRIVTDKIAPEARGVIDAVDEVLRRAPDGNVDFRQIQEARRVLTKSQGTVTDPSSRAAIGIAKKQLDQSLDDLTEATILSGDVEDIKRLKNAIGISRGVFKKFSASGKGDKVGKVVENILQNGNLDDLSAAVLGSASVSPRAGVNFARAVKRTLGKDAPELQNVRQAVLLKAATKKTGDELGMQAFSSNLKSLLNTRRDLMAELFTKEEISKIGRLTQALDSMQMPGIMGRSSGTAERMIRTLDVIGQTPLVGQLANAAKFLMMRGQSKAAVAPISQAGTAPLLPAAAATQSSNR